MVRSHLVLRMISQPYKAMLPVRLLFLLFEKLLMNCRALYPFPFLYVGFELLVVCLLVLFLMRALGSQKNLVAPLLLFHRFGPMGRLAVNMIVFYQMRFVILQMAFAMMALSFLILLSCVMIHVYSFALQARQRLFCSLSASVFLVSMFLLDETWHSPYFIIFPDRFAGHFFKAHSFHVN